MTLIDKIIEKIKIEIEEDPNKIGYKDKADTEILYLINNPQTVERVVVDIFPSPINRILSGIANAPNQIDLNYIIEAKK